MESKSHDVDVDEAVSCIHRCIMDLSVYIITVGKKTNCPIANCFMQTC